MTDSLKKVLIITYYWPPGGGSAVQRWVKFVKYLRDFGWEPVVYTPANPQFPVTDQSLVNDIPEDITIIKRKIWEPYKLFKWFTGRRKEENLITGFTSETKRNKSRDNISNWIRSNFFIPDARKYWIKPSVAYLVKYLRENPVDLLVTTGPPHSMHLIGMKVKNRLNIKWVADFRDPWTNIDFYSELLLTRWADNRHHRQEKEVLNKADQVVVVGETMKSDLAGDGVENVEVITNGFDEEEYPDDPAERDSKFSLVYTGLINPARESEILWKVLAELIAENKEFAENFVLKLIGNIDHTVIENLTRYKLTPHLEKTFFLGHDEIVKVQRQAQILLLLLNNTQNAKGIVTGKLFEYLAARRPVLAIGPIEGDAAKILAETNAGLISGFDDHETLKKNISHYFELYRNNKLFVRSENIGKYSRKALTKKLSELFGKVIT